MRNYWFQFCAVISVLSVFNSIAQETTGKDTVFWAECFREAGVDGTFVLLDMKSNELTVCNAKRSETRFLPASTFKIMNTLIALQNKTVSGIDETFRWDGVSRSYESWNKDLSLREAFRISAVWVYQDLAEKTGRTVIEKWLKQCNYGNTLTGPEINSFWLDGDIAISPAEQVDFIRALCLESLPFDKSVQKLVKEIMLVETGFGKELHAKTGWAARIEKQIGWYVGYVQDVENTWVFALNIDINKEDDAALRTKISRKILGHEGIFPYREN